MPQVVLQGFSLMGFQPIYMSIMNPAASTFRASGINMFPKNCTATANPSLQYLLVCVKSTCKYVQFQYRLRFASSSYPVLDISSYLPATLAIFAFCFLHHGDNALYWASVHRSDSWNAAFASPTDWAVSWYTVRKVDQSFCKRNASGEVLRACLGSKYRVSSGIFSGASFFLSLLPPLSYFTCINLVADKLVAPFL